MSENSPKVVLTEHLDDACADWLGERVNLVRQSFEDPAALTTELADAAGLVVRTYTIVNDALLDAAPNLRVVARAGVGLDNIDLDACQKRSVRVVYTPDANTQAVVEYVWALMLDALRPRVYLKEYCPPPTFHRHRKEAVGTQLNQLTLGILGMGRIGRRVAQIAAAMGVKTIYNDLRTFAELGLPTDTDAEFVDKPTLWSDADVLTIHVDGRSENRNLIDAAVLARLKPTALLLNTSRGFVVDPDALATWAKAHPKATTILDVHEPEPMPDDYPLWEIENVKLLPHLASRTDPALRNMSWVVRDVVRVLNGEEPQWPAV